MLWSNFDDDKNRRAKLARRVHEYWLNRAVTSGHAYPHIPTRAVSEGGFTALARTPNGRAWADAWWADALEQVD